MKACIFINEDYYLPQKSPFLLGKTVSTPIYSLWVVMSLQCLGLVLGILVFFSNYVHILNFSFSIPTYYFKLMFYYYFLPKDMSRNATLRIISEYLLDKR